MYIDMKTGKGPFRLVPGRQVEGKAPDIFLISMDMVPPQFYLEDGANTPALDSLKKDGVFFRNAFASAPLCGPSRASYLTGRYPYITGNSERAHDGHATELRGSDIIWPEYLKAAGYHTRHSGKSHVGTEIFTRVFSENDDPWHRWSPPWYDDEKYLQFLGERKLERFSFDREIRGISWSGSGEGNSYGGWLKEQNGRPFPEDATYPAFLVSKAINSIERRRDTGKPLYFQLDFFGPHQPFAIPGGWEEREREIRRGIKLPESWKEWEKSGFGEIANQPRVYQLYRKNWGMRRRETLIDYLVANQLQYELIDRMIGNFLYYLKEKGLYKNSLIIFIADHGEMNGEWGCIDKGAYLNPQVLRVPIILKLPDGFSDSISAGGSFDSHSAGISAGGSSAGHSAEEGVTKPRGVVCDTPCSLLDIAPTVLEAAGIEIPERLDGVSLLDTLSGMKRPDDKPIMFDVWNHVVPNPSVGMIFESSQEISEGKFYLYTYNATDSIDELYDISGYSGLENLFGNPDYEEVYREALSVMNRCLSQDERWEVYKGYFQLENAEKLKLPPLDTQKFL